MDSAVCKNSGAADSNGVRASLLSIQKYEISREIKRLEEICRALQKAIQCSPLARATAKAACALGASRLRIQRM